MPVISPAEVGVGADVRAVAPVPVLVVATRRQGVDCDAGKQGLAEGCALRRDRLGRGLCGGDRALLLLLGEFEAEVPDLLDQDARLAGAHGRRLDERLVRHGGVREFLLRGLFRRRRLGVRALREAEDHDCNGQNTKHEVKVLLHGCPLSQGTFE